MTDKEIIKDVQSKKEKIEETGEDEMIFRKLDDWDDLTLNNFNSWLSVDEEENNQILTNEEMIKDG